MGVADHDQRDTFGDGKGAGFGVGADQRGERGGRVGLGEDFVDQVVRELVAELVAGDGEGFADADGALFDAVLSAGGAGLNPGDACVNRRTRFRRPAENAA